MCAKYVICMRLIPFYIHFSSFCFCLPSFITCIHGKCVLLHLTLRGIFTWLPSPDLTLVLPLRQGYRLLSVPVRAVYSPAVPVQRAPLSVTRAVLRVLDGRVRASPGPLRRQVSYCPEVPKVAPISDRAYLFMWNVKMGEACSRSFM